LKQNNPTEYGVLAQESIGFGVKNSWREGLGGLLWGVKRRPPPIKSQIKKTVGEKKKENFIKDEILARTSAWV